MKIKQMLDLNVLKKLLILLLICLIQQVSIQAQFKESEEQYEARMKWWTEARFGMFIHWGTYAMAARHEWIKNRERMTDEEYQKYCEEHDMILSRKVEALMKKELDEQNGK